MDGAGDNSTSSDESGGTKGNGLCKQDWQCLREGRCLNNNVSELKCKTSKKYKRKSFCLGNHSIPTDAERRSTGSGTICIRRILFELCMMEKKKERKRKKNKM